ncbi:molybdopterin molybdenumtransferase MoeA [Lutibacter sp. HS1-25]|uniref:molybdopterin molybdotransferase MoeA n=1 Tax=Lutibacter sp. HS1-25 TaxID=2485000 RepID=UPI001013986E|nr:molybdopterin molybdotransferase MoeA [Lutibacter sp. HS1-25]RXP44591.1 molybdopterin molybdenumtransferase MoeA [Lutibacter sp. HS1-25]
MLAVILNNTLNFGVEEIDFINATGRILKETIVADRDFPPFDRVSMDGIAIAAAVFSNGQRTFKIEGIQAAGSEQLQLKNSENCIEAMTGAILPKGCDVVIPYELLTIEDGKAQVNLDEIKYFQNIHPKGFDKKVGDVLIAENTKISPAEIGVLATVGKSTVKVGKQPKVMIVSTGNELVDVTETPAEHQIRKSNVYTLVSLLDKLQIKADTAHILDDKQVLKSKIEAFLNDYDVLLFSGAVSKGKFDFIPEVLSELGVEKLFHQVKQRPGKPFWFGVKSQVTEPNRNDNSVTACNQQNKVVFAFPGNPVSTFVNCLKYFHPWYYKSADLNVENQQAILAEDFYFKPSVTYFLQVKLTQKEGVLLATPVSGKGSGDLANLIAADAFLELPDDRTDFKKGECFPILLYR